MVVGVVTDRLVRHLEDRGDHRAPRWLINLLAAAIVGVVVPLTLRRLRIDPALSAGVILTTFTDCIGFATLLGLGTLFLT